ncbi:hypothetical protein [Pseudovibrio sp. Tun.PSC04-5.I4]|uniref:hypothetical protein n=1 Tax=Pseudovibrio sp. Tun.PSC04-5.I4 TaxID=1798213 RepID=UPI0008813B31|nr:hypothetical protein [Pseudovibrio sp. Tun.PSC04-5.I4]SDQ14445.1 hypothetical protein SAMN04515695_0156 [Pseudovibrio sp. Tun.PSC04-5.I4]
MKCFILTPKFSYKTHTGLVWATGPDRETVVTRRSNVSWDPYNDVSYETGANTWAAAGILTKESKIELAKLYVIAAGARASLEHSHVIGDLSTSPRVDTAVDEAFVSAMNALDPSLFEFTLHKNVIDGERGCPPWDGPVFLVTVLSTRPSYDLAKSDLRVATGVKETCKGSYRSCGARRVVKASVVRDGLIWRDAYTRDVMCTQPVLDALEAIGVPEWDTREIEVFDDMI